MALSSTPAGLVSEEFTNGIVFMETFMFTVQLSIAEFKENEELFVQSLAIAYNVTTNAIRITTVTATTASTVPERRLFVLAGINVVVEIAFSITANSSRFVVSVTAVNDALTKQSFPGAVTAISSSMRPNTTSPTSTHMLGETPKPTITSAMVAGEDFWSSETVWIAMACICCAVMVVCFCYCTIRCTASEDTSDSLAGVGAGTAYQASSMWQHPAANNAAYSPYIHYYQ